MGVLQGKRALSLVAIAASDWRQKRFTSEGAFVFTSGRRQDD